MLRNNKSVGEILRENGEGIKFYGKRRMKQNKARREREEIGRRTRKINDKEEKQV